MTGTLSTEANGGSLSKASDTDHVTSAHLVSLEIREARRSLSEISSVKMSFLSHFGLEGLFIIFIMLVVSSACAYIVLQYSSPNFMNAGRPWLWIYVLLFVLYVATACLYLGRWKSYAQAFGERILAPKPRKCDNNIILQVSVSGPLFLWKLYIMEFIEGLVQLYNMLSLYLCSLPVSASVTISVLLGLDSAFRAYLVEQKFTPKLRNRQLQNDLFFDALVIALPSMLLHWGYQVIIPLDVLIQICAYPLFCIWLKLRSILREMIRNRTNSGLGFQRTMVARSIKRRRESVFGQDLALKLAEEQQQRVPYAVRATLKWYNVLYSVVFIGTGTIHLLLHADLRCNADIWEKCIVKVPFCNSIFSPTCNCAVLKVLDHNWTRLPREINEMRALQKIIVNRGPLASLENVGSAFPRLTELNLAHNRLLNFKMGNRMESIVILKLSNNLIKNLPGDLFNCNRLQHLDLRSNRLNVLQNEAEHLIQLRVLILGDNNLTELPVGLGNLPALDFLYADANNLSSLPPQLFSAKRLKQLNLQKNNRIDSIPEDVGQLTQLRFMDVSDNAIESLPHSLANLLELKHLNLGNNPICHNGRGEKSANEKLRGTVDDGCSVKCSPGCKQAACVQKEVEEISSELCVGS